MVGAAVGITVGVIGAVVGFSDGAVVGMAVGDLVGINRFLRASDILPELKPGAAESNVYTSTRGSDICQRSSHAGEPSD